MREISSEEEFLRRAGFLPAEKDGEEEFLKQIPETEKKFETLPPEEAKKQLLALFEAVKEKKNWDPVLVNRAETLNLPDELIHSPEIIALARDLVMYLASTNPDPKVAVGAADHLVDLFKSSDEIMDIPEVKIAGRNVIDDIIINGSGNEQKFLDGALKRFSIPEEYLSRPDIIGMRCTRAFRDGGIGAVIKLADMLHLSDDQTVKAMRFIAEFDK
jgi:hypothetical protein